MIEALHTSTDQPNLTDSDVRELEFQELVDKIRQLEGFIAMQLRINQQIIEQLVELQQPKSGLILPDRLNS